MSSTTPGRQYVGRASPVFFRLLWGAVALGFGAGLVAVVMGDSATAPEGGMAAAGVAVVLTAVVVGVVSIAFRSVALAIEGAEVVVSYGRSPFRSRYRLDAVTGAEVVDLRFWQWGGYGYRGSRRLFKKAAIVVRTGEAVRLHLSDGTMVDVTVDGAAVAAAEINQQAGTGHG